MTYNRDTRTRRPTRGKYIPKRKVCFFCRDKVEYIDYKETAILRPYISDRAKISPRRKSGVCARHQRALARAVKRARHLALLPFVPAHIRKTGGVGLKS
jgi:small subunit ribosomal protein S18